MDFTNEKTKDKEERKPTFAETIVNNIKQLRIAKNITQEVLADELHVDTAVISNIEKGKRELKVKDLEIIATCLSVRPIDILTYPARFVDEATIQESDDKVSVTFEVSRKKRDYLLHLVLDKDE